MLCNMSSLFSKMYDFRRNSANANGIFLDGEKNLGTFVAYHRTKCDALRGIDHVLVHSLRFVCGKNESEWNDMLVNDNTFHGCKVSNTLTVVRYSSF